MLLAGQPAADEGLIRDYLSEARRSDAACRSGAVMVTMRGCLAAPATSAGSTCI